jgi:hypothetical protein
MDGDNKSMEVPREPTTLNCYAHVAIHRIGAGRNCPAATVRFVAHDALHSPLLR